jgi:hypothetical protein
MGHKYDSSETYNNYAGYTHVGEMQYILNQDLKLQQFTYKCFIADVYVHLLSCPHKHWHWMWCN